MIPVKIDQVGKYYRAYDRPSDRLKDLLLGSRRYRAQWALKDVNLAVKEGESVGIIGNNGAGKSTLLKLVAGVLQPSRGTVQTKGRVTAILALGAGFHPDFTGRENIHYSAELMGISQDEIKQRFQQIVAFSELADYIDRPVKTYSTGMRMRLGFALVTSVDPDILIVDEALAVGDRHFQQKCIERMKAIKENGTTILFCSHSMHHINQFCEKALWLEHGKVQGFGDAKEVVERYVAESDRQSKVEDNRSDRSYAPVKNTRRVERLTVHSVKNLAGKAQMTRGERLEIEVDFTVHEADDYVFGVAIDNENTGQRLVAETSLENGYLPVGFAAGNYQVVFALDTVVFREGDYSVKAGLLDKSLLKIEDYRILDVRIKDRDEIRSPSLIRVPVNWDVGDTFRLKTGN